MGDYVADTPVRFSPSSTFCSRELTLPSLSSVRSLVIALPLRSFLPSILTKPLQPSCRLPYWRKLLAGSRIRAAADPFSRPAGFLPSFGRP